MPVPGDDPTTTILQSIHLETRPVSSRRHGYPGACHPIRHPDDWLPHIMVTQAQIAKKLGISRQLVTFALAGYPQVSKESRERIQAAALEMGYRPNPHARALRHRKTGIIALWIPDQISTHYTHVARELGRLVKQSKHELIISEVGTADMKQIWTHVPVDGICAVDASKAVQGELKALAGKSVPVVSLGAYGTLETDHVRVDMEAGTMEVMRHLIGSGFRRIAHATFVRRSIAGESRRIGYSQAMREAGLKPEFILYPLTERQRPAARRLIQDHIREHGRPEAIFCHSDDVALGIYRGLCDAGIRVPDDVALVGCDGIEDTEYLECPLTTLVQPVAEMCETAWHFLQNRLADPALPLQQALIAPGLAIRDSSRRAG
jgi:DNA-binding LacI/PurR family transcriptional regulator